MLFRSNLRQVRVYLNDELFTRAVTADEEEGLIIAYKHGPDGKVIVSIFRGQPRALPFEVEMMERHPLGSQAFMPLSGRPYLVVVAPAGMAPAARDLRVFLARGDQGVNYAAGVWHHPLLALDSVCDFLVLDRSGSAPNCDEVQLELHGLIPALS